MTAAKIDIHPLSLSRLEDFLAFFDNAAFSDNPEWGFCYCQCFLEDHGKIDWPARTGGENRSLACARIASGVMRGLLAYAEGKVVGWCNAAPRPLIHALDDEPIRDAEQTGTIICFLVDPALRGRGIARALLDGACDAFRAQGLSRVEANPRPEETRDGPNHFGPMRMYLDAGFSVSRQDQDGSVWVERNL